MPFFFDIPSLDPLSLSAAVLMIDGETGTQPGKENAEITSIVNQVGDAVLPLRGFSPNAPIWKPGDFKGSRLHSLNFTQASNQRFYLRKAVGLRAGATLFMTFKHTATDAVSAQAVNAPMTVFGYNADPQVWSAGFSAGTARYVYGSGGGGSGGSSVPTNPVDFKKGTINSFDSGTVPYWAFIPNVYDSNHKTPIKLYVWLHGCGGTSEGNIWLFNYQGQSWITIAPGGAEGKCWFYPGVDFTTQSAKILSSITDIKKKFNISPREVFIGGYSSGGDIGYPILFLNSTMFAGGLFINTSPRGGGRIDGINAGQNATFKGHIYHVAHTNDNTDDGNYSPANVRADMTILSNAGWTTTVLEMPGGHYDIPGGGEANYTTPGRTDYDARTYLFPHINDGWMSPPGGLSTLTNYDSTITNLNDGKTHTVCWTHSTAGVLKVYVDGVLNKSWAGVSYNSRALLNIIGGGYKDIDCYSGSLAEAISYDGVLTDQNVRDLHSRATQKWF